MAATKRRRAPTKGRRTPAGRTKARPAPVVPDESAPRELTPKQEQFCLEYLIDLNASAAARRAGYAEKDADVQGPRLLGNVRVADRIASLKAERAKRTRLDGDKALREQARLAFSDIGDILDFSGQNPTLRPARDIPPKARRAIASVKVKRYPERVGTGEDGKPAFETVEVIEFKLWSKTAALDSAMRHLGLYNDKLQLTGKDGEPLIPLEALRAAAAAADRDDAA